MRKWSSALSWGSWWGAGGSSSSLPGGPGSGMGWDGEREREENKNLVRNLGPKELLSEAISPCRAHTLSCSLGKGLSSRGTSASNSSTCTQATHSQPLPPLHSQPASHPHQEEGSRIRHQSLSPEYFPPNICTSAFN